MIPGSRREGNPGALSWSPDLTVPVFAHNHLMGHPRGVTPLFLQDVGKRVTISTSLNFLGCSALLMTS